MLFRSFPKKPVRDGADKAVVTVEVDGGTDMLPWPCKIVREITRDEDGDGVTHKLEIIAKGGLKAPQPQTLLNAVMMKGIAFDPLKFANAESAEQVAMVKELVGLDFSELDAKRKALYEERSSVNKQSKSLQAKLATMPYHADIGEYDATALLVELARRREANKARAAGLKELAQQEAAVKEIPQKRALLSATLSSTLSLAQAKLEDARKAVAAAELVVKSAAEAMEQKLKEFDELQALPAQERLRAQQSVALPEQEDEDEVLQKVKACQSERDKMAQNKAADDVAAAAETFAEQSKDLSSQDRKSTRLNSSHTDISRMPSSA